MFMWSPISGYLTVTFIWSVLTKLCQGSDQRILQLISLQIKMKSMKLSLGQFSLNILSNIPENLCCSLCSKVMENPHQAPCGCRFCFDCISNYLKDQRSICPGESEDCFKIKLKIERDLRPDVLARREISKLIVKCPLYLCDQELEYGKTKVHLTECNTSTLCCSKCNESIARREYENHIEKECKEGVEECTFCNELLIRKTLQEDHFNFEYKNLCSQYTNYCPNDCGEREKVVWKKHRLNCKKKFIECPYSIIGCICEDLTLKKMSEHMADKGYEHAESLLKQMNNIINENEQLKGNMGNVTNELTIFRKNEKEQEKEIKRLNDYIVTIKNTMEEMKKRDLEKMNEINLFLQNEKSNFVKMNLELTNVKKEIESMKKKYEDTITQKMINFNESNTDLNFTKEESIALVWNICNFTNIHNLYSPSFYTHIRGYKMMLRLFKITKGYLSIYACLQCGEYDDQLAWPFCKWIKIRIIDQEQRSRNYEKIIMFNDRMGNDFKRKYGNSFGEIKVSNFISYQELHSKPYLLKDDGLTIHCIVDDISHN